MTEKQKTLQQTAERTNQQEQAINEHPPAIAWDMEKEHAPVMGIPSDFARVPG